MLRRRSVFERAPAVHTDAVDALAGGAGQQVKVLVDLLGRVDGVRQLLLDHDVLCGN